MTPQQIAKELLGISWLTAQSDCQEENEKITYLLSQIEMLPPKQGLRLILSVLEVVSLMSEVDFSQPQNPFKGMGEFNGLRLDNFPTDEYLRACA